MNPPNLTDRLSMPPESRPTPNQSNSGPPQSMANPSHGQTNDSPPWRPDARRFQKIQPNPLAPSASTSTWAPAKEDTLSAYNHSPQYLADLQTPSHMVEGLEKHRTSGLNENHQLSNINRQQASFNFSNGHLSTTPRNPQAFRDVPSLFDTFKPLDNRSLFSVTTPAASNRDSSPPKIDPPPKTPTSPWTPQTMAQKFQDPPETETSIYVLPNVEHTLLVAMSMVDFIPKNSPANAAITVMMPAESTFTIDGLGLARIEEACPLLGMSFEKRRDGCYKYCLEVNSRILAVSLIRFLYDDTYLIKDEDGLTLVPSSILFHARMYHLGITFDLPKLKMEAKAHIMRVTEFACSTNQPPQELCEAIRFIYTSLASETELINIVQHYCVHCFRYHNLGNNNSFRALVDDIPKFGIDLCKTNVDHKFEDEGAQDIIQLPKSSAFVEPELLKAERNALRNFVYEMWGPENFTSLTGYEPEPATESDTEDSSTERTFVLVRRPKAASPKTPSAKASSPKARQTAGSEQNSPATSDFEGFTLVNYPVQKPTGVKEEPHSSDDEWEDDWRPGAKSRGKARVKDAMSSSTATIRPAARYAPVKQEEAVADDEMSGDDSDFTLV